MVTEPMTMKETDEVHQANMNSILCFLFDQM